MSRSVDELRKRLRAALGPVKGDRLLADALRAGFAIAEEHAEVSEHDGWEITQPRVCMIRARQALDAAIGAGS